MTTVYLVRHGQASAGTDNYDRLSELGMRQSTLLGEHWARLNIKPDAAFAGSLQRQQHTAQLVLEASKHSLPVQELTLLNEYRHDQIDDLFAQDKRSDGPIGNITFDDYHTIMSRWHDADINTLDTTGIDNYESFQAFETRGMQAIRHACEQVGDGSVVLFTSGGVVATVLKQLLNKDFTRTLQSIWFTRNSSVTTLEFNENSEHLLDYNTVSHLDYHCDPSLITQI